MGNARTGLWSALGALVGGAIGATAGRYAATARPRARSGGGGRYGDMERYGRFATREQGGAGEIEDAMVIGGATGAVLGAFVAGTVAGEDPPPTPPALPAGYQVVPR